MIYLLDTNTCILYLNGRSTAVIERLDSTRTGDVAVCDIVKAEMYYGAERSKHVQRNLDAAEDFCRHFRSLPFDGRAARTYGRIRARLEAQGQPIGPNDFMIAAIALANELTLVTNNVGEFSRVEGLSVEDWAAEE